jgi:hypothetical protein
MHEATATTYEHLANAIIEIRKTEDSVVAGILMHHESSALTHLAAGKEASGSARASHLEAAATEITYIANEGDKQVQAIRQRLLKAGHHHHHHADAENQGDYILIDSAEKKSLLDLANRVGRLGSSASPDAIDALMGELSSMVGKALAAG